MNKIVKAFLSKHNFPVHVSVNDTVDAVLYDMNYELANKAKHIGQEMISTYMLPPSKKAAGESVIVIDAGGTNFRSCLVTFDKDGKATISEMEKTVMPAVDRELSKKEFFDQFAKNLEHLKNKATRIGFCFSYSMTITSDGDGILNSFSKEVKAPEVIGCKIGQCLSDALVEHGWNKPERISLINDTVAALLAGASVSDSGFDYSSYVGFILGTGMNLAYIQPKIDGLLDKQIVVCESGGFNKLSTSDFDREYDSTTAIPGFHALEKQCSGGYLGPLMLTTLHTAAKEDIFSKAVAEGLSKISELSLVEAGTYLHAPNDKTTILGKILSDNNATKDDYINLYQILDAIVERSARYSAALLIAAVIQSGEGSDPTRPVCLLCDGSTFYKTNNLMARVQGYVEQHLSVERNLFAKIVSVENDITMGSAISGLV